MNTDVQQLEFSKLQLVYKLLILTPAQEQVQVAGSGCDRLSEVNAKDTTICRINVVDALKQCFPKVKVSNDNAKPGEKIEKSEEQSTSSVTRTLKLVKFYCTHPLSIPKHDLALKRRKKQKYNMYL